MDKYTAARDSKRAFAFLLSTVMIVTMIFAAMPAKAYAEEDGTPPAETEQTGDAIDFSEEEPEIAGDEPVGNGGGSDANESSQDVDLNEAEDADVVSALSAEDEPIEALAATSGNGLVFNSSDGKFHYINSSGEVYTGQADKWSWDAESETLTLKGFQYTATNYHALTASSCTILLQAGTTNTLAGNDYDGLSAGAITITGTGTLNVTSKNIAISLSNSTIAGGTITATSTTTNAFVSAYGIFASGNFKITGGTITAKGPDFAISNIGSNRPSHGIYVYDSGTLTIEGGTVNAIGRTSKSESVGMYIGNLKVSGGTVIATGGTVKPYGGYSFGINITNESEISGGSITATGGTVNGSNGTLSRSIGFSGRGEFSGGTITAKGGTATGSIPGSYPDYDSYSLGISIGLGRLNGATIIATGGTAKYSYGIGGLGHIERGTLKASGKTNVSMYGNFLQNLPSAYEYRSNTTTSAPLGSAISVPPGTPLSAPAFWTYKYLEITAFSLVTDYTPPVPVTLGADESLATFGLLKASGKLPETVELLYDDDGDEETPLVGINAPITGWSQSETPYDGTAPGNYILKAAYAVPNGMKVDSSSVPSAIPVEIQVNTAQTRPSSFEVIFDANGGTAGEPTRIVHDGDPVGVLPEPTYSGYVFTGWYTDQSGGEPVSEDTIIEDIMTLYARWSPAWVVTWNANGGTVDPASVLVEKGTVVGTLPVPVRAGYKFLGWYTEKSGGTKITAATKIKKKTTYYAHWVQLYTITWDANEGVSPTDSVEIQKGKAVGALPKATRTGYSLKGWYTAKTGGSKISKTTVPAKSRTYYAQWTAKTYTVTYDVNGGKVLKTNTKKVTFGKAYGTLAAPTRTGYKFIGWYTEVNGGGNLVTKADIVTNAANHSLYAHWAEAWIVTWNANGGKKAPAAVLVVKGEPLGALPTANPTRTGYTFAGWGTTATSAVSDVTETSEPSGDTTYYALWTAKEYAVKFNANGGKIGADKTKTITETYAATYTLPDDPARASYKFLGWYTAKSGGSKITAASVVKITKATTLYARWSAAWKVTWNTNSLGEVAAPVQTLVQKGKSVGTLPTLLRDGYTFKGWYTKAAGGSKIKTTTKPTKNVTYFAQWTPTAEWTGTPAYFEDIGETLTTIKNENPSMAEGHGRFPYEIGAYTWMENGGDFAYYFYSTQGPPTLAELAATSAADQLKVAGIYTTVGELFPETTEDTTAPSFFASIGISSYKYSKKGEDGWDLGFASFDYKGYQVLIDFTSETSLYTGVDIGGSLKKDYPPKNIKSSYKIYVINTALSAANLTIRSEI